MKLTDIHQNYLTDKGTAHNYIEYYESQFSPIREKKNNILEIGVLHGGSIKMWNDYFENSQIYGLDDFSHQVGYTHTGMSKVDWKDVEESLSTYDRVKLIICDSTDAKKVSESLKDITFDIIIDDGNHTPEYQVRTIELFYPFLAKGGIYIVEDVVSRDGAKRCAEKLKQISGKDPQILEFNVQARHDDRLVVLTN